MVLRFLFVCDDRGGQGLLPDDDGLDEAIDGGGGGKGRSPGGPHKPNKRRLSKNKKYGFGGQKRKFKQNDSKSLNDFSAFNPKKGKATGGKGGKVSSSL
jgi:rRNA-processing protein EBP2